MAIKIDTTLVIPGISETNMNLNKPKPAAGELVRVIGKGFKFGNGVDTLDQLPYEVGSGFSGTYYDLIDANGTPEENWAKVLGAIARAKTVNTDVGYFIFLASGIYRASASVPYLFDRPNLHLSSINGEANVELQGLFDLSTQTLSENITFSGIKYMSKAASQTWTFLPNSQIYTTNVFKNCSFSAVGSMLYENNGIYENCLFGLENYEGILGNSSSYVQVSYSFFKEGATSPAKGFYRFCEGEGINNLTANSSVFFNCINQYNQDASFTGSNSQYINCIGSDLASAFKGVGSKTINCVAYDFVNNKYAVINNVL